MMQTSDRATSRRATRLAHLRPRVLTSGRWRAARTLLTVLMGTAAVIAGVQVGLNAPDVSPITPPAPAVAAGGAASTDGSATDGSATDGSATDDPATDDGTARADGTRGPRDQAGADRGPGRSVGRGGRGR